MVRADLRPPTLNLSDVHANAFDAAYSFGPAQVPSGWISAIVHTGNRHFRLVTTHLQGPVPGDPTAVAVQTAQATQLIHELRNSTVPVVLAGDFNSDAILAPLPRPGPDNTGTAALIVAAGYTDIGIELPPTWPLYREDLFPPPPFFAPSQPYERIDLIFSQGLGLAWNA